jgi:transcriptional regulator
MANPNLTPEMKKGSAELLILAILEDGHRHGYEIARQIEVRSRGTISFHVASLYPILYRLEARELIEGRWVEKAGQRRRRYYRLTSQGIEVLAAQRSLWAEFFTGINRVARLRNA